MMPAKVTTPGLLKIKIFQNKGYDVKILEYCVTKEILSRNSNYIVDDFLMGGLGSSSITWNWH